MSKAREDVWEEVTIRGEWECGSRVVKGERFIYETSMVETDHGPERLLVLRHEASAFWNVTVQEAGSKEFCFQEAIDRFNEEQDHA